MYICEREYEQRKQSYEILSIPDMITKTKNNLRVSNAILLDISIVLIDNRGAFIGC